MISPVGGAAAHAHNAVADVLEVTSYLDYIDPMVAILEQVTHPFGTQVIAIALDSKKRPIYYYRLLKRINHCRKSQSRRPGQSVRQW